MKGRHGSAIGGETVVHRPDGGLGAVVDVDLAQQGLQVDLDGRFRDAELDRDHLVAGAGHQGLEEFLLTGRQAADRVQRVRRGHVEQQGGEVGREHLLAQHDELERLDQRFRALRS